MVGICAMILIRKKFTLLLFTVFFFVITSCETITETFNDLAGISKQDMEEDYYSEVPELVLPPDFGKKVTASPTKRNLQNRQTSIRPQFQNIAPTVNPRVTNYVAPNISSPSPTPSHSLEKFKNNRKFTIGQWVYNQYVDGFKNGNVYYRPIYDKGYNFSRRYVPEQNIYSIPNNIPYNQGSFSQAPVVNDSPNFNSFEELPILE